MDEIITQPVEAPVVAPEAPVESPAVAPEPKVEVPVEAAPPVVPVIYVGSTPVTPVTLANGLVSVQLDGFELKATKEQFDAMKSDTVYEDGLISIRKWRPTIAAIVAILVAGNCEMQDKDFVMQRVDATILENFRNASAKLFNVPDNGHVTLSQVIEILNPKS